MSYARFILVVVVAVLLLPIGSVLAADQQRKIAVLPFSFHSASDDTGDVDVGAEVAKALSSKIAQMPGWVLVDQSDVSAILQRQDTADLSGMQIGRLLGADAIVTGAVQAFEFDMNADTSAATAAVAGTAASAASSYIPAAASAIPYVGSIAGLAGIFGSVRSSVPSSPKGHAKIVIDAKVIDVYSSKEISVLGSTATSRKSATNLWGSGGPNSDFLSTSFANCVAGQATFAAIDDICKQLLAAQPKIDALAINHVQGVVTDMDDDLICVSVGKANGFKIGDRFVVEQSSINSSDSDVHIGTIILTDVGNQASLAKLIDGNSLVLAGDTIRGEETNHKTQAIGTVKGSLVQ